MTEPIDDLRDYLRQALGTAMEVAEELNRLKTALAGFVPYPGLCDAWVKVPPGMRWTQRSIRHPDTSTFYCDECSTKLVGPAEICPTCNRNTKG